MAALSSILALENPWTEEPGGYSPWGCKRVGHDLATKQQQQQEVRQSSHMIHLMCAEKDANSVLLSIKANSVELIAT